MGSRDNSEGIERKLRGSGVLLDSPRSKVGLTVGKVDERKSRELDREYVEFVRAYLNENYDLVYH